MNFFDSFTKGAQRVLIIAQEEARRMGHNYVGTEHILLGTIKEKSSVSTLLSQLGVTYEKVCAEIESQKVRVFCENETVNLILSAFAGRAEESGVPLRVRAEVPHFIPVAETDLCVLLSNALENALHACQRLRQTGEPCDIELVVYEKSGKFFLQMTNTCPPGVTFEKGLPVTREPGHGIGVRSICSIAERYNGMYSFSEKDGRFVLRVSL